MKMFLTRLGFDRLLSSLAMRRKLTSHEVSPQDLCTQPRCLTVSMVSPGLERKMWFATRWSNVWLTRTRSMTRSWQTRRAAIMDVTVHVDRNQADAPDDESFRIWVMSALSGITQIGQSMTTLS